MYHFASGVSSIKKRHNQIKDTRKAAQICYGWVERLLLTLPAKNIAGKLAHCQLHAQTYPCIEQVQHGYYAAQYKVETRCKGIKQSSNKVSRVQQTCENTVCMLKGGVTVISFSFIVCYNKVSVSSILCEQALLSNMEKELIQDTGYSGVIGF